MGKRKRKSKSTVEYDASSSNVRTSKKSKNIKKKRKNWSADLDKRFKIMTGAVEDVIERNMTIRKAAEKWGVKRSTLADRVSGRVELGRRSGPPTILTRAEEQMLADWVISMAQRGFGFNKHKLLKTVKKILDKDKRTTMLKNKKNMPGNKWYRQFLKRNPRVKIVTSNQKLDGLDKLAKPTTEYEALNSMIAVYESDSGSESESDFDSEAESESESEVDVEAESPPQASNDVQVDVIAETELIPDPQQKQDLELHMQPEILSPSELDIKVKPEDQLETRQGSSSPLDDFTVDPNSDPDMSVGITVTITTSE